MICPECQSKTYVYDTRQHYEPNHELVYMLRRRKCSSCETMFYTMEITAADFNKLTNEEPS